MEPSITEGHTEMLGANPSIPVPHFCMYSVPVSLYCAKLRLLMRFKILTWDELPPPGGYGSEAYRALVPAGSLPALQVGEHIIADSEAIAEYLEESVPLPPALPTDLMQRAQVRALGRFHDTRLEPCVRALFSDIGKPHPRINALEQLKQRLQQLPRALALRPNIQFCLADCGLIVSLEWIAVMYRSWGLPLPFTGITTDYQRTMEQLPWVSMELDSYRPLLAQWIQAKNP
jgi:glutathione S-transferase/maleylpyruvate isomerase